MAGSAVVQLMSSDDETVFKLEHDAAMQSATIYNLHSDNFEGGPLPPILIPHSSSQALSRAVQYLKFTHESTRISLSPGGDSGGKGLWDENFLAANQDILVDLLGIADYLDVRSLFRIVCRGIHQVIVNENNDEKKAMLAAQMLSRSNVSIVDIWGAATEQPVTSSNRRSQHLHDKSWTSQSAARIRRHIIDLTDADID